MPIFGLLYQIPTFLNSVYNTQNEPQRPNQTTFQNSLNAFSAQEPRMLCAPLNRSAGRQTFRIVCLDYLLELSGVFLFPKKQLRMS